MADTQHIRGLDKLNKFLQTFPVKFEKSCVRGGLRAGAVKELLPEVQANVLSFATKSGELMTGLKVVTRSRRGRVTAAVVATGPHAYLAKWMEYGVKAHNITAKKGFLSFLGVFAKSVMHPGIAPYGNKSARGPHSFMRPALDHSGGAAVVAAGEYMRNRLETAGLDVADIDIAEGP
ncbi:MAG: hypothetical protein NUV75_01945 [Gallionella sp.]|nr:hypothetical protein [Gallionella sp.]